MVGLEEVQEEEASEKVGVLEEVLVEEQEKGVV